MSALPLLSGATQVLKISPLAELVPEAISSIDQLFSLSLLDDDKFIPWRAAASAASKIGVIDVTSGLEVARYVDAGFNADTPAGSVWFSGPAGEGKSFYLQAGAGLAKTDQSSIFADHLCAYGFNEGSGSIIDRCNNHNGTGIDVTYEHPGKIDLAILNGINSYMDLGNMPDLHGIPKCTFHFLIKLSDLTEGLIAWDGSGTNIDAYNGDFEASIDATTSMSKINFSDAGGELDEYCLISIVFDGAQTDVDPDVQNHERFKIYLNGEEITWDFLFGDTIPSVTFDSGTYPLELGFSGGGWSTPCAYDEMRIMNNAASSDEILLRANQWLQQSSYWTVTVMPVISSVEVLGEDRFLLRGGGFKPEAADPTGTVGEDAFAVESCSDTECVIVADKQYGSFEINLQNSDGESDSVTVNIISEAQNQKIDCGIHMSVS
jgi:hypothetical protein